MCSSVPVLLFIYVCAVQSLTMHCISWVLCMKLLLFFISQHVLNLKQTFSKLLLPFCVVAMTPLAAVPQNFIPLVHVMCSCFVDHPAPWPLDAALAYVIDCLLLHHHQSILEVISHYVLSNRHSLTHSCVTHQHITLPCKLKKVSPPPLTIRLSLTHSFVTEQIITHSFANLQGSTTAH